MLGLDGRVKDDLLSGASGVQRQVDLFHRGALNSKSPGDELPQNGGVGIRLDGDCVERVGVVRKGLLEVGQIFSVGRPRVEDQRRVFGTDHVAVLGLLEGPEGFLVHRGWRRSSSGGVGGIGVGGHVASEALVVVSRKGGATARSGKRTGPPGSGSSSTGACSRSRSGSRVFGRRRCKRCQRARSARGDESVLMITATSNQSGREEFAQHSLFGWGIVVLLGLGERRRLEAISNKQ